MKKLSFAAFIAFWSSVATIAMLHVLAADGDGESKETEVYTLQEVATHNRETDCWMVIAGRVYDITGYVSQHPTPPSVLLPWCGKEATQGMRTKGYGRDHSEAAWGRLPEFQVGTLAQ